MAHKQFKELKILHDEYDSLTAKAIDLLSSAPGDNHFHDIKMIVARLEQIDQLLSSSSVVRLTIDLPDDDN